MAWGNQYAQNTTAAPRIRERDARQVVDYSAEPLRRDYQARKAT
jgi:hypothetical protein